MIDPTTTDADRGAGGVVQGSLEMTSSASGS
jgi:hypothetical protein